MGEDVVVNMPEKGVVVDVPAVDAEHVVVDMSVEGNANGVARPAQPIIAQRYPFDMKKLEKVSANVLEIEARSDMLHPRSPGTEIAVFRDADRGFGFGGKHLPQEIVQNTETLDSFLLQNGYSALKKGYSQNIGGLAANLLQNAYNKSLSLRASPFETDTFGTVMDLPNKGIQKPGVSGIGYGLSFATKDGTNYSIPGTIFARGKLHAAGGAEIESGRGSNPLIKIFLEHTPLLNEETGEYTYPSLIVDDIEIIDANGALNEPGLKLAIDIAQSQEDALQERFGEEATAFDDYINNPKNVEIKANLNRIKELVEVHRIKPVNPKSKPGDLKPTLDTVMAIDIFHDLLAVLNGEKIENYPALIDAIIWCGDPDLSKAIKEVIGAEISADLIMLYGSGDSTADLAQAYFDALKSNNQNLINDSAALLLNDVMNSSKKLLAECAKYDISNIEIIKALQEKIDQPQSIDANEKVEAALTMKLLMEQVKVNDEYMKEHKKAKHHEFLVYTCKGKLAEMFKDKARLSRAIDYDWKSDAKLILSFMKEIKEEDLKDYTSEQLEELDSVLATLKSYYNFLDDLRCMQAGAPSPETEMFGQILISMIAKLAKDSGIQDDTDLIQVLAFLKSWGFAQPENVKHNLSVISVFRHNISEYNDYIAEENYGLAYNAASILFEGALELYKKYNAVFKLSNEQENAMAAFKADIEIIKETVQDNPEALQFLADILYQESLRLGQWMEQAMMSQEADIVPSFVSIPVNELMPMVLDEKLGALDSLIVKLELGRNETVEGHRTQLKGYLDKMKEESYNPELFVKALSLLYKLEKYLDVYESASPIVREQSLSMFPSFSQSNPRDFDIPTSVLQNQTLPGDFDREKSALRNAFTEEMQAILPQALREEIEILLGKEYIEGWESEIVANNKRNIEGFKKYNIILNYISGDTVGNQQLPEELKGLHLALVHHLFKEKSIEEIGLTVVENELEKWFGTNIASTTSLIEMVNKYHEKIEAKDYKNAYGYANNANIELVRYYKKITGAKRNDPLVIGMNKLIAETKAALKAGHITHKVAAETLHQVNLELINCVSYLAGPKNKEFKPATSKEDWNKIGNDSMKAADSPKKKWASRILMGVGIILAIGFSAALVAGFLVVTGGFGAIPLAAVGVAVGSVVSPTIAVAAVGALAASSFGISAGFAYSRRKDVETCKQNSKNYLDSIEEKVGAIEVAVSASKQQEQAVAMKDDSVCHKGVPIEKPDEQIIEIEPLDFPPVDDSEPKIEESKPDLDLEENENGHEANAERQSFVPPLSKSHESGDGICSSSEDEEGTAKGLTGSYDSSTDDELYVDPDLINVSDNFGMTFLSPPRKKSGAPAEEHRDEALERRERPVSPIH